jgi:kynurenine formamidase
MSTGPARTSNWGRWGEDDERGTLNLVTPDVVHAAAGLVRTGRVFELGQSIQESGVPVEPRRPGLLHLMRRDGGDYAAGAIAPDDIGTADDYLGIATHGTTHVDALCHLWYGGAMYNGFSPNEVRSSGAGRNGIDKTGPIVTRGVLLDVAALHGVAHLPAGHGIGPDELDAAVARAGVEPRPGDALLVRTGWLAVHAQDPALYHARQPGVAASAVPWIAERDPAALGADNLAVEQFPAVDGSNVPVHRALLRDYGIHLIELLDLEELAAAGVAEFLFVAAPLRIKRGAGSPLNPLAIT